MSNYFNESNCEYIINACAEILDVKAARPLTKFIHPDAWPEERGVKYDGVLGVDFSVHYGPQGTENVFDQAIAGGKPSDDVYAILLDVLGGIAEELSVKLPDTTVMVGEFTDVVGHELHVFVPYDENAANRVAETRKFLEEFGLDERVEKAFNESISKAAANQ